MTWWPLVKFKYGKCAWMFNKGSRKAASDDNVIGPVPKLLDNTITRAIRYCSYDNLISVLGGTVVDISCYWCSMVWMTIRHVRVESFVANIVRNDKRRCIHLADVATLQLFIRQKIGWICPGATNSGWQYVSQLYITWYYWCCKYQR